MSAKYRISAEKSPKVEDMPVVSATQLKNATADVFDLLAKERAVAIRRHDKPRAVLLSVEEYESLTGGEDNLLSDLLVEYQGMLAEMQSPEQKAGAAALFEASGEELGRVAMEAAMKRVASGEIRL